MAIFNNHKHIFEFLVECGANFHVNNELIFIETAANGDLEMLEYLITNGINISDEILGESLCLAADHGHYKIVDYLINILGVDVNISNTRALCNAVINNHLEIVKLLVKYGANIHI